MQRAPTHKKESGGFGVASGLALGPVVGLGLARFAYALLLPSMRAELHWSFATAGAMNAANALGYLAGAVFTAPLARRIGVRRTFIFGMGATVLVLFGTAATANIAILAIMRAVSGISGAMSFIAGAGLVAELGSAGSASRSASLLGVYVAGGGAGIVMSGMVVPWLLDATSKASGWRLGWVLLGCLGAAAFIIAAGASRHSREPPANPNATEKGWPARKLVPLLISYALFGTGYIAYMTFIIAFLDQRGASPTMVGLFWVVLGASAMAGAFVWARPIGNLAGGKGTALILAIVSIGALLPLVSNSVFAAMGSAILFGGSFLSVVTAVASVARETLQSHHWTPAIATLTVAFALGQGVGPVLSGALSDGPAGLTAGLGLSVAVLVAAAIVALFQRVERPCETPAMQ